MKNVIIKNDFDRSELRRLGVELLVAFGSRIEGTAREQSDYDIGVLFDKTMVPAPRRYGRLYALLQEHLSGYRIDLVDLAHAPYPLQFRAAIKGAALYEISNMSFADFRERAMLSYFDFRPVLKIHEDALGL